MGKKEPKYRNIPRNVRWVKIFLNGELTRAKLILQAKDHVLVEVPGWKEWFRRSKDQFVDSIIW